MLAFLGLGISGYGGYQRWTWWHAPVTITFLDFLLTAMRESSRSYFGAQTLAGIDVLAYLAAVFALQTAAYWIGRGIRTWRDRKATVVATDRGAVGATQAPGD